MLTVLVWSGAVFPQFHMFCAHKHMLNHQLKRAAEQGENKPELTHFVVGLVFLRHVAAAAMWPSCWRGGCRLETVRAQHDETNPAHSDSVVLQQPGVAQRPCHNLNQTEAALLIQDQELVANNLTGLICWVTGRSRTTRDSRPPWSKGTIFLQLDNYIFLYKLCFDVCYFERLPCSSDEENKTFCVLLGVTSSLFQPV